MSNKKFTPGPWHAHDGWGEQDYVYYKTQNQTASNIICKVFTRPKTNKRGCPDAHLIAAAPDMYKELERLSTLFRKNAIYLDEREKIETILRKARGESEVVK